MEDTRILVDKAARGDEQALGTLLVRHLPSLEAYIRLKAGKLVRAKEATMDLVQSVCCDVLGDLGGFEYRSEGAFRNWLFKRALRKIINKNRFYRTRKRDAALDRAGSSLVGAGGSGTVMDCYATICTPSRIAMGHEAVELFEKAFEQLNEDYREAITLYRVVGLSYGEIAKEMSRSEGAVRNLVYRGLARLSTLLDEGEA